MTHKEERIISVDTKDCPDCNLPLTIVRCPCHRHCRHCKILFRVDLDEEKQPMTKEEFRDMEILKLESSMIDFIRFYLAFRIVHCEECNVIVQDWEPPIIFTIAEERTPKIFCEKHKNELEEFNHKYTSD